MSCTLVRQGLIDRAYENKLCMVAAFASTARQSPQAVIQGGLAHGMQYKSGLASNPGLECTWAEAELC